MLFEGFFSFNILLKKLFKIKMKSTVTFSRVERTYQCTTLVNKDTTKI